MLKKCWLTLWNVEIPNNKTFAFLQQEFVLLRLLPIRWIVLLALAPIGFWAARKWGNQEALFLTTVFIGLYSAGNIVFFLCDRYRYPVWPAMAALAGGGLAALLQSIRRREVRHLTWMAGCVCLLSVLSLHNWFNARLPSFARDYLFRSLAYYQKGQFQQALTDIDEGVRLDPRDGNALHHRANVLFALGRLEDARMAFELTLKQIPEEGSAWNNLGATLDQLGKSDDALAAYARALTCNPPSRNAFLGTAFIHIRAGHLADAAAVMDKLEALEGKPDAAVLALRSVLERRGGNTSRANELEAQARQLDAETAAWAIESSTITPSVHH